MKNLPVDIIDYIWSFDDRKYKNYTSCIKELNIITHKLDVAMKFAYGCRDAWWFFHRYKNKEYRYILFKIRERKQTIKYLETN